MYSLPYWATQSLFCFYSVFNCPAAQNNHNVSKMRSVINFTDLRIHLPGADGFLTLQRIFSFLVVLEVYSPLQLTLHF